MFTVFIGNKEGNRPTLKKLPAYPGWVFYKKIIYVAHWVRIVSSKQGKLFNKCFCTFRLDDLGFKYKKRKGDPPPLRKDLVPSLSNLIYFTTLNLKI